MASGLHVPAARAESRPRFSEIRCSESFSNLAANRCPKIRASEALYRAAIVQRTGEKWPIGERDGRTGRPRGPELIAKTTPSLGPTKGRQSNGETYLLRPWRRERNWDPTFSRQSGWRVSRMASLRQRPSHRSALRASSDRAGPRGRSGVIGLQISPTPRTASIHGHAACLNRRSPLLDLVFDKFLEVLGGPTFG